MKDITKTYSNGEVTIVWKPAQCIHSTKCWKGLSEVFHPAELPWITPEKSTTAEIIKQVNECPSGALSFLMNNNLSSELASDSEPQIVVEVTPNGPLMVHGNLVVKKADGSEVNKPTKTAFCRCGHSDNKPFCDGTHRKVDFKG